MNIYTSFVFFSFQKNQTYEEMKIELGNNAKGEGERERGGQRRLQIHNAPSERCQSQQEARGYLGKSGNGQQDAPKPTVKN